jgi:hypothetical protein
MNSYSYTQLIVRTNTYIVPSGVLATIVVDFSFIDSVAYSFDFTVRVHLAEPVNVMSDCCFSRGDD